MGQESSSASSSSSSSSSSAPLADGEHFVRRGHFYRGELPPHLRHAVFAAGCFWGTEKSFWRLPGVYSTAVVYIAGRQANPTYRQVCSGTTGHAEATLVVYDPALISLADLLRNFYRCHNPTQGNRQGRDAGSQYRSGIYLAAPGDDEAVVRAATAAFQTALTKAGFPSITTEIRADNPKIWYAETYHQQYLAKPGNRQYCSAEPTGARLPPIEDWPQLTDAQRESYAPKLPPAFWATYDGSIRAPHAPARWEATAKAEKAARKAAEQAEAAWAKAVASAEDGSGVVVHYCGGCGFGHRADELASYLQQFVGFDATVAKLQDRGTTGRFTVRVRRKGGSWVVVHANKAEDKPVRAPQVSGGSPAGGDGFVDSVDKLEAVMREMARQGLVTTAAVDAALAAGRDGSIPFPTDVAASLAGAEGGGSGSGGGGGGGAAVGVERVVDFYTGGKASPPPPPGQVVVFAKTWCGYCRRAVAALKQAGFVPFVLDMDRRSDEKELGAAIAKRTGQKTVPAVFHTQAAGTPARFVGGATEAQAELASGALRSAAPLPEPSPAAAAAAAAAAAGLAWARELAGDAGLKEGLQTDGEPGPWLARVAGAGSAL